jgi:hypothetical protein
MVLGADMVVVWVAPELATVTAVVAGVLLAAEDAPNDMDVPAAELDAFAVVAAPPLDD